MNRVYPKPCGYIVDYVGLSSNLKDALSIYSSEEQQEILDTVKGVEAEEPILRDRYNRLIQLFEDAGVKQIKLFVEQNITDAKDKYEVLKRHLMRLKISNCVRRSMSI